MSKVRKPNYICTGKDVPALTHRTHKPLKNMEKAVFYHAGCPVCVNAEDRITELVDRGRYQVEHVHLGQDRGRIAEAEAAGVRSVPALVVGGDVLHINHGASMAEVKG